MIPFHVIQNIMIDEADEAMPGQPTGRKRPAPDSPASSPRPNKRKPGEILLLGLGFCLPGFAFILRLY